MTDVDIIPAGSFEEGRIKTYMHAPPTDSHAFLGVNDFTDDMFLPTHCILVPKKRTAGKKPPPERCHQFLIHDSVLMANCSGLTHSLPVKSTTPVQSSQAFQVPVRYIRFPHPDSVLGLLDYFYNRDLNKLNELIEKARARKIGPNGDPLKRCLKGLWDNITRLMIADLAPLSDLIQREHIYMSTSSLIVEESQW